MVKIKVLLHRSKPVAVFLAEQQPDIEILFFNYQVHYKEYDISPTYSMKGSVIKVIGNRYGDFLLLVDKASNLDQYPVDDIPFVILGDGDILLKTATTLDHRKEEYMELDQKKKRPGMLFGDDESSDDGGMGGLFNNDEDGGEDSLPLPVDDASGSDSTTEEEK